LIGVPEGKNKKKDRAKDRINPAARKKKSSFLSGSRKARSAARCVGTLA